MLILNHNCGIFCDTNAANILTFYKACLKRNGSVIWGLELLVILVEKSEYSIDDAIRVGEKIGECNERITDKDVSDFIKKLEKIRK